MKKSILFILLLVLSTASFAQNENTYKGVVADREHKPLDVFSVVIFNIRDTAKQVYTNTFTNGNFDIKFAPVKTEKYGAYILSMGYKDLTLPLEKMKDTVIMPSNAIILDDAVVKGKRDVTSSLGTEGGMLFDVSNTYLSDMGSSTDLLNFIPGVKAERDGTVTMVGVQGEVLIYINNIKLKDPEKLRTYKSEDINSVEVLRSPGAKYKNAAAVILITTNKEYEGFSSLVEAEAFLNDNSTYQVRPSVQASYTKGKITASASYRYTGSTSESKNRSTKEIDQFISPENWKFEDTSSGDSNVNNHWYNANLDYRINDKHILTFQYTGRNDKNDNRNLTNQTVSANSFGNLMDNKYRLNADASTVSNTGHIYYKGDITPKFTIEYNADYSSRINDNDNANSWQQGSAAPQEFSQKTKSNASAFTTDVLLTNKIKTKHSVSYGLEYSYLKDDVTSNTKDGTKTNYKQNSTFLKTILEYKLQVIEPLSLSFGFNYLYNNIKDNNSKDKGTRYNSVVPYVGIQYYNAKKGYGMSLNVRYNNYQPDAGMLDDVTINYTSPYEQSTGNSSLKNMKFTSVFYNFNYKTINVGAIYQNIAHMIIDFPTVALQANNDPLITTKPINLTNPINGAGFYVGYSTKVKFWIPSVMFFGIYSNTKIPDGKGVTERFDGTFCQIGMENRFDLPKKYFINLSGSYMPKGYMLYEETGQSYEVRLNIEKRMLKDDQLRISLLTKIANKWNYTSSTINGLYHYTDNYTSFYKFIGISASWRFNNHKEVQRAKESAYMNML